MLGRIARSSKLRVAVLDDYHRLSSRYLADLSDSIDFTVFTDTLPPPPHPQQGLIDRLKPFEVILTMRERTPLNREVILALAGRDSASTSKDAVGGGGLGSDRDGEGEGEGGRLKVLMTTGMRNLGIDYEACKEAGVVLTGTPGKGLP
jgi:hypothetical protein